MILSILALAVSLSIDSLGIGISYGIRKIKIPIYACIIISAISFCFTLISISFGTMLLHLLPEPLTKYIGIFILMLMGVWIIYQGINKKENNEYKPKLRKNDTILNIIIKSMGITIKIIRTPEYCDMDNSSSIEPLEAFYLGIALSVDSFGAGIGTAVLGINTTAIPFCVALFQLIFLFTGLNIGKYLSSFKIKNNIWTILSGLLLILIGIMRIFL